MRVLRCPQVACDESYQRQLRDLKAWGVRNRGDVYTWLVCPCIDMGVGTLRELRTVGVHRLGIHMIV